ncbi:MAG: helix-turn-helix transcriptional regulator, partial [Alphaproteobacteria bacterium]|nr:helix-turn-helix transcriptional regulator [Alphaproteobacteria bacterium]
MAAQTPRAVSAVDRVIGARIRAYRHERGLSQGDLAAKLGLTFQQVQKYENGLNRVAASRLFEI